MVAEETSGKKGGVGLSVFISLLITCAIVGGLVFYANDFLKEKFVARIDDVEKAQDGLKSETDALRKRVVAESQKVRDELAPKIDGLKEAQKSLNDSFNEFDERLNALEAKVADSAKKVAKVLDDIDKRMQRLAESACRRVEEDITVKIKEMDKEILAIESAVNAKCSRLSSLLSESIDEAVADLNEKIASIRTDINELRRLIRELNAIVEEVRKK